MFLFLFIIIIKSKWLFSLNEKSFFLIEMNCKWSFHWIVFLISEFDYQ